MRRTQRNISGILPGAEGPEQCRGIQDDMLGEVILSDAEAIARFNLWGNVIPSEARNPYDWTTKKHHLRDSSLAQLARNDTRGDVV